MEKSHRIVADLNPEVIVPSLSGSNKEKLREEG